MKECKEYDSPWLRVFDVMVERGFKNSLEDPFEDEELYW